jgi:hypothetical protein
MPRTKCHPDCIAPELLLTCKHALSVVENLDCAYSLGLMCLVDDLRDLIAEAEGR